ncbi:MAG: 30S ribosomal protein S12 methylthiotransferase RimO [Rectinemataceae bacterium]|jgi:ribosomal protein S12 methylthiotransferase
MRFWIDRHGCAKNDVDGEEIAARLEAAGHSFAEGPEGADLVIVNTCGFIEDAKKESIEAVVGIKAAFPGKRVLVAGCLSQRYAAQLAADLPEADGIVGNADLGAVLAAAESTLAGERPVLVPEIPRTEARHTQLAEGGHVQPIPYSQYVKRIRRFDFPGTAHAKATEGCSNFCAFCAIPLIRGALRSRPLDEVLAECLDLVAQGARELVLIGQDLGSYGRDSGGPSLLPELLAAISAAEGDFRLRTLYIHPDNFPERALGVMAADPRILPYFDLPFQHASARILEAMNRRGSAEAYLELIARIRGVLPDSAIRSTFLIGFPGETDEDFAALRDFQERARLDWVGSFAYSREEGTAAYDMRGRVPKKTVAARRRAIEEAQERITRERLERFVGRELDVLVEEKVERASEDGEALSIGRTWNQAPEVDGLTVLRGSHEPGTVLRSRILAVNGVDFDAAPRGT